MTHRKHNDSIFSGIGLMLLGVVSMVGLDACAKWLTASYSLSQIVLVRGVLAVGFLLAISWRPGGFGTLRTHRLKEHLGRSVLATITIYCFFYALGRMHLADAVTIAMAAPILVTALSSPLLNETVGMRRWIAVLVGFVGVLVVLRPGPGVLEPAALAVLTGTFCYALLVITARSLARTETNAALALYTSVGPVLVSAILIPGNWTPPVPLDWGVFLLAGLLSASTFLFINGALRRAPVAVLTPFEYVGIVGAVGIGYWIWDEVPDETTLVGAGIIIASGIYIVYREAVTLRETRRDLPVPGQDFTATGGKLDPVED